MYVTYLILTDVPWLRMILTLRRNEWRTYRNSLHCICNFTITLKLFQNESLLETQNEEEWDLCYLDIFFTCCTFLPNLKGSSSWGFTELGLWASNHHSKNPLTPEGCLLYNLKAHSRESHLSRYPPEKGSDVGLVLRFANSGRESGRTLYNHQGSQAWKCFIWQEVPWGWLQPPGPRHDLILAVCHPLHLPSSC